MVETLAGAELLLDEVTAKSDPKWFPPPTLRTNRFEGQFVSDNAELAVTVAGRPLAEPGGSIAGPSAIVIKALPTGKASPQVWGGLRFAEGGAVRADPYWLWTDRDPGPARGGSWVRWRRGQPTGGQISPARWQLANRSLCRADCRPGGPAEAADRRRGPVSLFPCVAAARRHDPWAAVATARCR